jgi:hypothetical protein
MAGDFPRNPQATAGSRPNGRYPRKLRAIARFPHPRVRTPFAEHRTLVLPDL